MRLCSRFFIAVALTLGIVSVALAWADGIHNPSSNSVGDFQGIDSNKASGSPAFVGPGDVKTGWNTYYAMRAFSAATKGNKLANICNSTGGTDVLCADALSDATTGNLVIPGSLVSFCPGANCTVKIWYDISGANFCSAVPCDATQNTVATRPILTANAIGTKTCLVANGSTTQMTPVFTSLSQPTTVTAIAKYAVSTGSGIYYSIGSGMGYGMQSNFFGFYANSAVTGVAGNTSAHALQNIANGASSFIVVDSTVSATQNAGSSAGSGGLLFNDSFSNFMNGALCETGDYPAAFTTTDAANMNSNQHAWGGF